MRYMTGPDIGLNKTWIDLVRDYFPQAGPDECDFILWEETCFPFGSIDQVERQLSDLKTKSGAASQG